MVGLPGMWRMAPWIVELCKERVGLLWDGSIWQDSFVRVSSTYVSVRESVYLCVYARDQSVLSRSMIGFWRVNV